jgi:hypothetical protein
MELCSIDDAFPNIAGHDHSERKTLGASSPSKEERRAAKKKAKRCKGPALEYLESQTPGNAPEPDPDRPSVKRLGDVPAFVSYADAFPDVSGGALEGFAIPKLTSSSCVANTEKLPAYFGAGDGDEEGFANYSGMAGDNPNYQLVPEAIPGFDSKGVEKAGSGTLPALPVSIDWKPTAAAKAKSAYFDGVPIAIDSNNNVKNTSKTNVAPVTSTLKRESAKDDSRDLLLQKIQELTKRLDDLERKEPTRNTQKELLMFVGTGIFLLISFDVALRATR